MKHSIIIRSVMLLVSLFVLSFGLSAKKVVCIDGGGDGFLNSHEGWERANATSTTVIQVGGSLTDCLAQLADGDTLVIVAHGVNNGQKFRWGGVDYTGFGSGTGQMPVPEGFGELDNIKVDFCSCWSKKDPDGSGSNKSLADKLAEALGNNPTVNGFTDIANANSCFRVDPVPGSGVRQSDIDAAVDSIAANEDWSEHPPANRNPEPADSDRATAQAMADAKVGAGKVVVKIEYYRPTNGTESEIPAEGETSSSGAIYTGSCGCDGVEDYCGMLRIMQDTEFDYIPPVTTDVLSMLPAGLYAGQKDWIFISPDPAIGDLIRLNDVRIYNFNPSVDPIAQGEEIFIESFFDVFFDVTIGDEHFEEVAGNGVLSAMITQMPYSTPESYYWDVEIFGVNLTANTPLGPINLIPSASGLPSVGSVSAETDNDGMDWQVDSFFDVYFDIDFNGSFAPGCGSAPFALRCDASAMTPGCTEPDSGNFNPCSALDDGSCSGSAAGCTYPGALNYNPNATIEDGSCILAGCMDQTANNYNPLATNDDGSCDYALPCPGDINGDGARNSADLLDFLAVYGEPCVVEIE